MRTLIAAAALTLFAALPAAAQTPAPAPLADLVRAVDIPHQQFTLRNGLRVIVHEDRKAPIVAVSVWYGVGAADEPAGKTGFAHLFEHLMFNGSGNYDGEFFVPLEEVGATNYNGTTNADRTNYFQNVPTPALERALFLEADRMGNLLPAVTQEKLDNQRGVVQNEKRQGDNQPYGLFYYAMLQGLFPQGHPYHHSTIGSMADLDAATLADVQDWFKRYYGPNNAVLVLAGDIDAATARPLVERYFGAIPRGSAVPEPRAAVPQRTAETRTVINDRVANTRLYFTWAAPGRLDRQYEALDVALTILGSGDTSRLHQALVREEQLALSTSGGAWEQQLASMPVLIVDVKPGADVARVETRVREIIAKFFAEGPTQDEVQRVATRTVSGAIRGYEQIGGFGGKAVALAEGALYANDANFYKRQLNAYATVTPAQVRAAARAWINDGSHLVVVQPGERGPAELAIAGAAAQRPAPPAKEAAAPDRSKLPPVTGEAKLSFPAAERATLSNGVRVTLARRTAAPIVTVRALFDAGAAADDPRKLGTQRLTLFTMREGTTTRTGRQIGEELERLGAVLNYGFGQDATDVTVTALKPNLAASLGVMSDMVRNPAFAPAEVERLRAIQLSLIAQQENEPGAIASRTLQPLIFGAGHPYGKVSGVGTTEGVRAITRDDLVAFHASWMRPDTMQLFVVGDITMAELMPQLETAFGGWRPAPTARGTKAFSAPTPQGGGRILLIDRPNSPQSVIAAGMPVGVKGADDPIALNTANTILGGAFTSRINSDLRETKGWSYGARSGVSSAAQDLVFTINAPVQSDRTGDSIAALKQVITAFQGASPATPEELQRAINNQTLSLPGTYETAGAVLQALQQNAVLGRPDDYQLTYAGRVRALGGAAIGDAARQAIDVSKLTWVVVGDAKVVEPQLAQLGMPVEVRRAAPPAAAGGR